MSVRASAPYALFVDAAGVPLVDGFIFIGVANQDPTTNQIAVYSDAALTVSVAQPIRTMAGAPVANGTPINLFVGGNYSITVKDRNGVLVYTVPSAALAGGDITIAPGETLEVESGGTVDMKDGSTLNLGDGTGSGVEVVVAATTRITGNLVPSSPGLAIGTSTLPWDANLLAVVVETEVVPKEVAGAQLGTVDLPFSGVSAEMVNARDVATYGTDQPAETADLVKRNALTSILASGVQTSTTSTAATEQGYNIDSITRTASTGVYTVTFSNAIGSSGVRAAFGCGRDGNVEVNVSCGTTSATVIVTTASTGAAVDAAFNFFVVGNPEVTDPIATP